jgi:hypothetical protein
MFGEPINFGMSARGTIPKRDSGKLDGFGTGRNNRDYSRLADNPESTVKEAMLRL